MVTRHGGARHSLRRRAVAEGSRLCAPWSARRHRARRHRARRHRAWSAFSTKRRRGKPRRSCCLPNAG